MLLSRPCSISILAPMVARTDLYADPYIAEITAILAGHRPALRVRIQDFLRGIRYALDTVGGTMSHQGHSTRAIKPVPHPGNPEQAEQTTPCDQEDTLTPTHRVQTTFMPRSCHVHATLTKHSQLAHNNSAPQKSAGRWNSIVKKRAISFRWRLLLQPGRRRQRRLPWRRDAWPAALLGPTSVLASGPSCA